MAGTLEHCNSCVNQFWAWGAGNQFCHIVGLQPILSWQFEGPGTCSFSGSGNHKETATISQVSLGSKLVDPGGKSHSSAGYGRHKAVYSETSQSLSKKGCNFQRSRENIGHISLQSGQNFHKPKVRNAQGSHLHLIWHRSGQPPTTPTMATQPRTANQTPSAPNTSPWARLR